VDSGEINSADMHIIVKRRRGDVKNKSESVDDGRKTT
jgi:hypothetical protein